MVGLLWFSEGWNLEMTFQGFVEAFELVVRTMS
jgi:hypothetical protein